MCMSNPVRDLLVSILSFAAVVVAAVMGVSYKPCNKFTFSAKVDSWDKASLAIVVHSL